VIVVVRKNVVCERVIYRYGTRSVQDQETTSESKKTTARNKRRRETRTTEKNKIARIWK